MIQNIGKTFILWLAIILAVTIGSIIWVQNSLLFYPNTSIFNWSPDEEEKTIANFLLNTEGTNGQDVLARNVSVSNLPALAHSEPREPNVNRDVEIINTMEERSIMIPDKRGDLSAYYIHNFAGKDFLVYCHGTSGNISDRKYVYDMAQTHQLNLLLFDYHGYGKSTKYPTVDGILKDGLTVIDFLTEKKMIQPKRIIVWGESLGGAVAAYIAKLRPIKGVVLMSTFSSMPHLISEMDTLGWIRFPLSMISRITLHSLETARWISQAKIPVVIMHSKTDDYITYNCGLRNFEVAKEPKLLIEIDGKHISPSITNEKIIQALEFIEQNR